MTAPRPSPPSSRPLLRNLKLGRCTDTLPERRRRRSPRLLLTRTRDRRAFLASNVVIEHDTDQLDSLQAVPVFHAFVAGIADRCDVAPVATGATLVGGYR